MKHCTFPVTPFEMFTVANKMHIDNVREIGFHPDDQYREWQEKQDVPPGCSFLDPEVVNV